MVAGAHRGSRGRVPTAWFLAASWSRVQRRLLKWRGPVSAPAVGCALGGGGAQHVGHRFRHTTGPGAVGMPSPAILNLGLVVPGFQLGQLGSPAKAVR